MKLTGITRKVDSLGRMVIPKELRDVYKIERGTELEICINGDYIILKEYIPADIFTGSSDNLIEYCGKKVSIDSVHELNKIADGQTLNDSQKVV